MSANNDCNYLSPLEPWLENQGVSDILKMSVRRRSRGNGFDRVSTPSRGNDHLMEVVNSAVQSAGHEIERWSPSVDTTLPDGFLQSAMLPPQSLFRPALTTSKLLPRRLTDREQG